MIVIVSTTSFQHQSQRIKTVTGVIISYLNQTKLIYMIKLN